VGKETRAPTKKKKKPKKKTKKKKKKNNQKPGNSSRKGDGQSLSLDMYYKNQSIGKWNVMEGATAAVTQKE